MSDTPICGVVLAGGRAERMGGGDKALLEIGGETILDRALESIAPFCSDIVLNANGDASRFAAFGLPVVADSVPDFAGPLAGILAGMDWAQTHDPEIEWIASVPGDCPFLPQDLLPRLQQAALDAGKPIACAKSGERLHPLAAVWRVSLREDLRRALGAGERKVEQWAARHGVAHVEWPVQPFDPFLNVNSPDDLRAAEEIAEDDPDL
ncbi:MAG: molybdenum cofactor guanylyltransferase MobA [Xanthobacteraceae bacterium]|nr:molybdenum cofactor guanylyltransferase MobA [Xanthobacteraceae bacterium]MCW5678986.1 molybdenum cofactor guanylyltransferase MobA [Xanthobacteraceae bacterium]